ncbi:hypothetical protein [Listeria booriae]|uniref:Uncharacterized protein n=1 Tax=Listeria booriae TaxID=1552123 RepID=A0A841XWH8_9LIST|nr:hypothetical protein [Listeria booriae]MBC1317136.1 hypothetical protein [Listeria booriae]
MRQILQDYLEISKQPLRKEKNRQYKIWFETNYEDLPNFDNLIVFFASSDKSYFLMNKLLFPMRMQITASKNTIYPKMTF